MKDGLDRNDQTREVIGKVAMRIGIIGAGVSGLVAAYRLNEEHDVTVFEANNYIGGHTNTIAVEENGKEINVDTGFIVFNDRTYPNFISLIDELGVASQKTQMSFSVRCEQTGLEYRGADLNGLFAQRKNLVNPRFLRLLYDLVRFKGVAAPLLESEKESESVRQFLARNNFSKQFVEQYFLPMGSAIWSCPFETFMEFPIRFIAEFYQNHGLLGVSDRPQWRVIKGGSKQYIAPLTNGFTDRIHLNSKISGVIREPNSVAIQATNGDSHEFDHVIFACHADQALAVLAESATATEKEILSCFPYEKNVARLHTQSDVLPKSRRAWACWNYLREKPSQSDAHAKATVTYNMNILQSLECQKTYCVTLNDTARIRDENILREIVYHHPTFNVRRREMQLRQADIIGPNRTSFCGAYWGNGFHEDGVKSAIAVVEGLTANANRRLPNEATC